MGELNLAKRNTADEGGFTLVEVMTVLLIIGLMTSVVILTRPQDKPVVQTTSEQLVRDINRAIQTSLITGRPMALGLSNKRYALLEYQTGDWREVKVFDLSRDVRLQFFRQHQGVDITDNVTPVAMFMPTGDVTEFRLILQDYDVAYTLEPDDQGRVIMKVAS